MKRPVQSSALALVVLLLSTSPSLATAPHQATQVFANRLGTVATNYGMLGNNWLTLPSLGFPLQSGYEHMPRAGLWVGAHAIDSVGSFTGVITGANDLDPVIYPEYYTEWTPLSTIVQRSAIPSSPIYDPAAASDLDVLASYDDHVTLLYGNPPEANRPMGLSVRQQVCAWDRAGYENDVFMRYVITNGGAHPLTGVWIGMYAEFASGNARWYGCWPPVWRCGPGRTSWFSRKWVAYDDSLRLLREHYCYNQPVPGGCYLDDVPPWVGLELLTRPTAGQGVTVAAWKFSPNDPARDQDVERYALMSAGTVADFTVPDLAPGTGNPVEVLALGPFDSLAPGDSVTVDFALLGGMSLDSLRIAANLAQRFRDTGVFDGVVSVENSLLSAEAFADVVRLRWWSGASVAATVERSGDGARWTALGDARPDGTGGLRYEDRAVAPGARYAYRLRFGDGRLTAAAWVAVPLRPAFALHGVRPNPVTDGDPLVGFSLDGAAPATLELFDLAGRRVRTLTLDAPAPGERLVRLTGGAPLAPGVYALRLAQGERRAVAHVTIAR